MKNKGFTLVELMVTAGIALSVFGIVTSTYLISQRMWRKGFTQITFQSAGRIALEKISQNLRSAINVSILDNGDRIRFVTDPNRTYSDASDDITKEYYVSGTDIIYNPDNSVSGEEVVLLRNVSKEPGIPFFQASDNFSVVTFKVYKSDAFYGNSWSSFTTSVHIRNI